MKLLYAVLCPMGLSIQGHAAIGSTAPISPIVGTWERTLPSGCTERYTFQEDGKMSGTSGAEYVEEEYAISAMHDAGGFFMLTGFTIKDTGGPDCDDSSEDHTGKPWIVYILFSPELDKHIACSEPNTNSCWGPYMRIDKSAPEGTFI